MPFTWNDVIWIINYPTEMLLAFLVFFIPLRKKKHGWLFASLCFILIVAIAFLRKFLPYNGGYWDIFYYLLVIVLIYLACHFSMEHESWITSLFLAAMVVAVQHLSYKITDGVALLIDPGILRSKLSFPIGYGIQIATEAIFYFLVIRKYPDDIQAENSTANIVGLFILLISGVVINIITYDLFFMDIENGRLISFFVNLLEILTTVLIILFLNTSAISTRVKEENAMLKMISEKERERYELAKITIDEINIKYHDLKHALKKHDLDEGEEKEIKETLTNYKSIVQTSNRGLNVVIYEYQLKCISKDIELICLLDGDTLSFMKSHHVYSLLSNLLDNSIEAVEKLDKDKRRINLKINKAGNNTFIALSNYVEKPVEIHGHFSPTTKKDHTKHGYGMRSIEQIVRRYDGEMSIENKGHQFVTKIMLPSE